MKPKTKYIYFFLFLFFLSPFTTIRAQEMDTEYYPEGTTWEKAWYYYNKGDSVLIYSYQRFTVSGDTTVNDTLYKKVLVERKILDSYVPYKRLEGKLSDFIVSYTIDTDDFGWNNVGPFHWEPMDIHTFCIREEDNKVFVRFFLYGEEERMIYDYNWEEGKTIEEWDIVSRKNETYTLDDIREICLLDGTTELALAYPWSDVIRRIRGVGELYGLFINYGFVIYDGSPQFERVLSFTRNGTLLYEWDPTEYLGIKRPEIRERNGGNAVYTLSGIRVDEKAALPPGIYIKNGKKVVLGKAWKGFKRELKGS